MTKLTFDTNCIINLLDYKSSSAISVDELTEITRYGLKGDVNIAITSSSLRINFTDNSYDETDVYVERQPSGGSYTSLGSFGMLNLASKWNWTNTGLQANKTYCYRLRAKNALGYSAYSNAVCATTAQ